MSESGTQREAGWGERKGQAAKEAVSPSHKHQANEEERAGGGGISHS